MSSFHPSPFPRFKGTTRLSCLIKPKTPFAHLKAQKAAMEHHHIYNRTIQTYPLVTSTCSIFIQSKARRSSLLIIPLNLLSSIRRRRISSNGWRSSLSTSGLVSSQDFLRPCISRRRSWVLYSDWRIRGIVSHSFV